jgi:hypothetical protein
MAETAAGAATEDMKVDRWAAFVAVLFRPPEAVTGPWSFGVEPIGR